MKVRFTPEAERQADESDTWWRQNRRDARDLFARELADAKAQILSSPNLGTVYTTLDGLHVRRVLMPKTRHHLYYTAEFDAELIIIHAVWGAPREHGPKL